MKIGIVVPPFYPPALIDMALDGAHTVGADSLWAFDHMLGVFHPELYGETGLAELVPDPDGLFDPFCMCAWAARSTRLPWGIAVTDSIRRAAPDVARAALSLQHLCPGGFNLGVGCGEAENLLPFGYSFDRPVARTERFLQTLRHLLDVGTMPDGVGRLGLPLESAAGRPKVWLAAHKPRMLRLTGQYADGWLPVDAPGPDEYRTMKATVADHAAAAGRPEPESGLFLFVLLGESRERIREMFEAQPMAKLLALWMSPAPAWARYGLDNPAGDSRAYIDVIPHALEPATLRALAPRIPFELVEEYLLMGDVEDVAQRILPYADAGLQHSVIMNLTGLVGGVEEAMARGGDLAALGQLVRTMAPSETVPAGT